jgi:endoglucanase A
LGSGIPVWSDLTISDGLKYISGSYKIAMVYSGDSAPMLVLENKHSYSWDICISASEVSSGVAFYSYDDIAQAFSNYGVSIYDMGQLHIFTSNYTEIYEVYAAPV